MPKGLKFIFITGCLEPGCDGVGDYTRLLAKTLVAQNHTCISIALEDSYVSHNPLRIPFIAPNYHTIIRFKNIGYSSGLLRECINGFNPDCISLQFVPYAFQKKGLCYGLGSLLQPFAKKIPFHVMMHEIWIGAELYASYKDRFIGGLQRFCIKHLLKSINPKVIHTHTPLYKNKLEELGYQVYNLPLFSSIIKPKEEDKSWFYNTLIENNLPITSYNRSNYWFFGIFGSLPSKWPPFPVLEQIRAASKANNKQAIIFHFGHIGGGDKIWKLIHQYHKQNISFVKLGPIHQAKLWILLQHLDFGISTTPYHLLPKSASAAAMLENGLPLIVNRHELPDIPPYTPYLIKPSYIIDSTTEDLSIRLAKAKKRPANYTVETVAQSFLHSINSTADTFVG